MNRVHKSQVRELLLQLTDIKNKLNSTFWDAGEDMKVHEEVIIKRALTEIDNVIIILTGVI